MKKQPEKIGFFEFVYVWLKLQGLNIPQHQKKMIRWLFALYKNKQRRQGLLMAFRNSGKSTIVGLFCAWALFDNPTLRILVMAADHALAKKMVRNVKRIIEKHPLTENLKPPKSDQWASDQFTVKRDQELRDPSMLAKGIGANITGLRADLIICDDVEVPKNCDTQLKRHELREKLNELDYIITPGGLQLYIGTPHNFYTIYQTTPEKDKSETEPFLLGFEKLELPIIDKDGNSSWPERFSLDKIASIRIRSGENKFLSQMMLQPVNFNNCILDVSKLQVYDDKIEISFANNREILKIGSKKMLSASCWWDPSFAANNGDNSVVACIFIDEDGHYWLHDIEYIKIPEFQKDDNIASLQCEKVADFLERNHLSAIRIEINGIGRFLPGILKQVLKKHGLHIAVLEVYSSTDKTKRILSAFEVLLAEKAINAHRRIWATPFIEEMREFSIGGNCHDDGLDAVSGCLISEPVRLPFYASVTEKFHGNWQGLSRQFNADSFFEIE